MTGSARGTRHGGRRIHLVGSVLLLALLAAVCVPPLLPAGIGLAVSLSLATFKAGLVAWFYMGLRDADRGTVVTAAAVAMVLVILVWLTFTDYATRSA